MKRLLPFILLLFIAGSGWLVWQQKHPRSAGPAIFHGNVDIREVRLGFRVSGRILEVLKDEGDAVTAGEIVARLDEQPFRNALALAEAQVQSLSAKLQELRNGNRLEEIEQARKNLAAAETTQENAWRLYQRQKQLIQVNAVPRQEYDNAESAWNKAVAQRDAAKANLDLLLAGTRSEQIAQAEANLAAAQANLAQARTQLDDTRLTAPESGTVLTRSVEPGSIVQPGSTALTVSLLSPVWARAYVTEPQLGDIHPGRDVLVYTDSRKEPYHGQVGDVSSRAEFTPKSVETEELRTALVYRFRVVIRDADTGLRQGMPVTVRLPQPTQPVPAKNQTGATEGFDISPKSAEAAECPAVAGYRFKVVPEVRLGISSVPVAMQDDRLQQ